MIYNLLTENAEDLDVVMPMYNLIEYRKIYRKTPGSLQDFYRDKLSEDTNDNKSLNKKTIKSKPFKYKTSITGSSTNYNIDEKITNTNGNEIYNPAYDANTIGTKEVEIVGLFKYLRNFQKNLDMPLINCKVPLTLTNSLIDATFKITNTKLHVPVVTLSTEDDNKLLEQLKTGFKRTIRWNKYRSEMFNQTKPNNLNYLIDPIFSKANRLFILSFENEDDGTSFSKYYTPNIEIKYFNILTDGKSFFDVPIKNKEET